MVNARMLGAEVERWAASKGMTVADLGKVMECSELQVQFFLKGRAYASFAQIERLAAALDTKVSVLLTGDPMRSETTIIQPEGAFRDLAKREFVLNLIYDYADVLDATRTCS